MRQRRVSVAAPGSEPLTLTEAKKHLEIATADTTHDSHITSLITAVRQLWEHDTQRLTVSRQVVETLEDWPQTYGRSDYAPNQYSGTFGYGTTASYYEDCNWRFYHQPVISITSIQYYDTANSQQTLNAANYQLDEWNRKIELVVGEDWPQITSRWDAVDITYQAGQATVDEIAKQAMKLQLDVMFELRGMTKNKDACMVAYERLVERFQRASYP